jgi:outer membrane protein assembly factor BamB
MRFRIQLLAAAVTAFGFTLVQAQDWPQWRGLGRDAKVEGFKAPSTWPKELTKKWSVKVGDGVATPSLVGDKLFVYSREGGNEILRCLNAADGKEIWQSKYEVGGATGPAQGFAGPRGTPAVADGKVVTLGVRGMVSCHEANTGKKLWSKDDYRGNYPMFFTSCSPIIVDSLAIVQLGGGDRSDGDGAIVAYDLASGAQKWKWSEDGTAYSSPILVTVEGTKQLVTETASRVVGISIADGKLLWSASFALQGRSYNAATPMASGQTVYYSGASRGTFAAKIEKSGDKFTVKELWKNPETTVQYNSPVLKDGLMFGLSDRNSLFCIHAETGKTTWTAPAPQPAPAGGGGKGKGMRMGGGYGSIVDAGSVLVGLTPAGRLIVFQPTDKEYKEVANYKVAESGTYAYPVLSGNRIFVKDRDSVTLWTID